MNLLHSNICRLPTALTVKEMLILLDSKVHMLCAIFQDVPEQIAHEDDAVDGADALTSHKRREASSLLCM